MRIQIVTRHCEVENEVRDRAEELVTKLTRFDPRVSSAQVIFTEEGRTRRAEGILHIDGKDHAVAHGDSENFFSSLDQMFDRLAKILRRSRDRDTDHQGPTRAERVLDAS